MQKDTVMMRIVIMNAIELKDISRDNCIVALTYISNACIGEITMGCKVDANEIGDLIYTLTGLNTEQLNAYCIMNETRIGKE